MHINAIKRIGSLILCTFQFMLPGHKGTESTEMADELVRCGSSNEFIGSEPCLDIYKKPNSLNLAAGGTLKFMEEVTQKFTVKMCPRHEAVTALILVSHRSDEW